MWATCRRTEVEYLSPFGHVKGRGDCSKRRRQYQEQTDPKGRDSFNHACFLASRVQLRLFAVQVQRSPSSILLWGIVVGEARWKQFKDPKLTQVLPKGMNV